MTAPSPTRVTHLVWNFDGGGLESVVVALAGRGGALGYRTSVISLSGRIGRVGEATRDLYDHLLAVRSARGLSMLWPRALARAISGTRPDVIHIHSGVWFKGVQAARLAGVPKVIFTEHGREHHDPLSRRWLDRLAAARTDAIVPVSARLERYLRDRLRIPAARLHTIENGIDVETFSPDPAAGAAMRDRLGIPSDARVIGSVGRLERVKGYDRLLDVFARLTRDHPLSRPAWLVLCGDGAERDALARQAAELGVAGTVRFPGWIDRPADVYRALDVFAVTSRSEGLSLSLLEAMACGAVPVVNDVGANAENLGEELGGQLVPGEDWGAFAAAVARTLADGMRLAEARTAARRRVVDRYSLDRVARSYAALYGATAPTTAP